MLNGENKLVTVFFFFSAPAPTSAMVHTAHICVGKENQWYVPLNCNKLDDINDAVGKGITAEQIVFSVQFPHRGLDMSRWHQFILGTMQLEISASDKVHVGKFMTLCTYLFINYFGSYTVHITYST